MEKSYFGTYFLLFVKLRSALHSLKINSHPRTHHPCPSILSGKQGQKTLTLKTNYSWSSLNLLSVLTFNSLLDYFFLNSLNILAFVLTT